MNQSLCQPMHMGGVVGLLLFELADCAHFKFVINQYGIEDVMRGISSVHMVVALIFYVLGNTRWHG